MQFLAEFARRAVAKVVNAASDRALVREVAADAEDSCGRGVFEA